MEYVLIWLVFGVVSSIIASNKGNSGCGGFLLGVLLGPIGLLIALFSSANDNGANQSKNYTRQCPYCAELVHRQAIVCKHCGRDIPIIIEKKFEYQTQPYNNLGQNKTWKLTKNEKIFLISIFAVIVVSTLVEVSMNYYNKSKPKTESVIQKPVVNNNSITIKQSDDIIQTFKQLHVELLEFKSTKEFKVYGLNSPSPYADWIVKVNDLKTHQNVNDLIEKGIVPTDLQQLALEYLSSKGKETEYTRNMNRIIKTATLP